MASKREFLTTDEVGEILGISAFTVRRYIQSRKLRAIRLEASYRVRRPDLERFITARQVGSKKQGVRSAQARRAIAGRSAAKAKPRPRARKQSQANQRRARRRPHHPA